MKLLINCSNIKVGGGIQVALSFINESKTFTEHDYIIVASKTILDQLLINSFSPNYTFLQYDYKFGIKSNKFLRKIEKQEHPDIAFSIFGPTYWTPKTPHLIGFARGHVAFPNSLYRRKMKMRSRLLFDLKNKILLFYTKRNADFFVVETENAKSALEKLLSPNKKIFCVSNTYSNVYDTPAIWETLNLPYKKENEFWLIHICANYPHKHLQILPSVISALKTIDPKHEYKILLSINESDFELTEEQREHFIFLGKLNVSQCPTAYQSADALLMTSLIETFSASYLEAMKMNLPILTSDLDFANDICQKAALYFNPLNAEDIAQKIVLLTSNRKLYNQLVELGTKRLKDFPTSAERAKQYLKICKLLYHETNHSRP